MVDVALAIVCATDSEEQFLALSGPALQFGVVPRRGEDVHVPLGAGERIHAKVKRVLHYPLPNPTWILTEAIGVPVRHLTCLEEAGFEVTLYLPDAMDDQLTRLLEAPLDPPG